MTRRQHFDRGEGAIRFKNCKAAPGKKKGHWLTSTDVDGAEVTKQNAIGSINTDEQRLAFTGEQNYTQTTVENMLVLEDFCRSQGCGNRWDSWKSQTFDSGGRRVFFSSVKIYQAECGQYLFNSLCTTLWNTISNKQEMLAPAFLDRLARVGITPPQILRSEAIPMGPPNLRGLGATKGDIANRRCWATNRLVKLALSALATWIAAWWGEK